MNAGVMFFLAFVFIGATAINRVLEGAFINSIDVAILNNILIFKSLNVFGLFSIPVINTGFITDGLPHLLNWDYSFFGGSADLIMYLLYTITAAVAFGLFITVVGSLASNYLHR